MTAVPDRAHPRPDLVLAQALAADLDAADFRSEPLRRLWGEEADDALARGLREPILRAIAGRDDPLATLGRLWVLGMPQPHAAVEWAVPRVGVDGLEALGLAVAEGADVRPLAVIRPQSFVDADGVGEWWIASDLDENIVRDLGLSLGVVDVKVAAIDDTWSGLKFVRRLADR